MIDEFKYKISRIELEDKIQRCWTILDDLRDVQDPYVQAVRTVYEVHFEKMWNTFENLCYEMGPKSEPSKYHGEDQ